MTDCTRTAPRRSPHRALVIGLIASLLCLWLAAQARADGDPASDVLAVQSVFLPQDAGLSAGEQLELASLVKAAQSSRFHLRVAVIASSTDLGSVTELWRQPKTYAHFLGQELSFVYHGVLLVVMPNGLGVYGVGGASADAAAVSGLSPVAGALGPDAVAAVRRLAAAAGHPLPLSAGPGAQPGGSTSVVPWAVFVFGLALIAGAWTFSLRLRPLRMGAPRNPPVDM